MDEKIKAYIDKQPSPQKEIILRVRDIFTKTLGNYNEKFAWGAMVYEGGKFYIAAMKNRVHVGFAITGLDKEEIDMFEGSGKTMRHIKIHSIKDIDEERLVKMINLVNKKSTCPTDYKG
ncbi:hypothetical protein AYK21_06395 [Thermoplasmatales archaeon SG8-52-2]|nr:MAG: hypothetical protein AYK21_06395 [Thermoplasmatales archaeon SG8-52-2]